MKNILELKNINFSYHTEEGETLALSNISFTVSEGEFVAVVGPSGCGKSTLLHVIAGLLSPESGSVTHQAAIGYMLQKDELLEWRNVYSNVVLGLEIQHKLNSSTKAKAYQMLETYGLLPFAKAYPSELSGGMRQRAALIRTLLLNPKLLLLDEPFSALDYQTRLNVGDDIGRIIRKEQKTAILVTHDLSEAVSLAERVLILTKRPATIQQSISIKFQDPDLSPLERRNAPDFKSYFNLIWKELNQND